MQIQVFIKFVQKYGFSILIALLATFLLFYKIGNLPSERWDEQTNFQVVSETSRFSNPLLLLYQGKAFLEKPPLWYYIAEVIYKLGGEDVSDLRMVSAFSGIGTVILIYMMVAQVHGRNAGALAVFLTLGIGHLFANNPVGEGQYFSTHTFRSADLDALMIFLLVLAVFGLTQIKKNSKWLPATGLVLSLTYLCKGPLAVVFLVVIIGAVIYRRYSISPKMWFLTLASFVIPLLVWHLYMWRAVGDSFWEQYLVYHLLNRSMTALEGHSAGLFYYFDVIFGGKFYGLGGVAGLAFVYFALRGLKKIQGPRGPLSNVILAISMILVPLIFIIFTIVKTKLAWYILPIYPFLSIIVTEFLLETRNWRNRYLAWCVVVSTIILALIGIINNLFFVTNL